MAATAVLSPPAVATLMASRARVPLANAPNVVNSPLRPNNGKRTRSHVADQRENEEPHPPRKRLAIDASSVSTRRTEPTLASNDPAANVFTRKPERSLPNSFNRRLANVANLRDSSKTHGSRATEKPSEERAQNEEQLRQWRRHYRRIFPQFIFYFESLPHDVAVRAARQVARLGACEEKFFSKGITHVVTTREIPPDPSKTEERDSASKTINPSLLHRGQEAQSQAQRGRNILDAAAQRRAQAAQPMDVLQKARQMGLKIWPLEKFERMMSNLFEPDLDDDDTRITRPQRSSKETDLRQLIKNERNGPVTPQELVPFKGYYIYIHDINERTKPVMLRDYPKPTDGDQYGDWPRFHSVSSGRCPFVEEPEIDIKAQEHARRKARAVEQIKARESRQTSLDVPVDTSIRHRTRSATRSPTKAPLDETKDAENRMPKPPMPPTLQTFEPPKLRNQDSGNTDSMPMMLGSARANFHGISRNPGGEPMASGMQARNVTSAIRSQAISSQAAAPGTRVGVTKEMHALSRRMVFSNNNHSNTAPSYMAEVRAAINQNDQAAGNRRTTRQQKGSRTLGAINEDEMWEDNQRPAAVHVQKTKTVTRKKVVKRDPKPGYCENCRDKYDDFLEHIDSKQHQKFALADDNFVELDDLLRQLART